MNLRSYVVIGLLAAVGSAGWAQQAPQGRPGGPGNPAMQRPGGEPGGDPLAENFLPPELIMQNQQAIGLTADQQTAIRAEMQKSMARFTDLQWQMSAENEAMRTLVKQERPDEKQVLAQLDKLLNIENEIKRLHVGTMIRIRNLLTPEQQTQLRELRPQPQRAQFQRQRGPRSQGQPMGNNPPPPPPDDGN